MSTKGYAIKDNNNIVSPDQGGTGSAKMYVALISQTAIDVPSAKVLINSIGTITWSRLDVGLYAMNSSSLFTTDKTVAIITSDANGNVFGAYVTAYTPTQIAFSSISVPLGGINVDGVLSDTTVMVFVYP